MSYLSDDIDEAVARALAGAYPGLYATLVELVRRGQTKAQIMDRVRRVSASGLTASACATAIDYLIRQKGTRR